MSVTITKEALNNANGFEERRRFICTKPNSTQDNLPSDEDCIETRDTDRSSVTSNGNGMDGEHVSWLRKNLELHKGLIFALMSCVMQALSSMGVKQLAGRIPSTQIAAFRLLFYIICASVGLVFYRIPISVTRKQFPWLLMRVSFGTVGMCLCFYSYQNIPVGDTSAILFTSPIFTGVFAWIILGEKFTLMDAALSVFALVGILLIARPSFIFGDLRAASSQDGNALFGVIAAVVGAIFIAIVFVLIRKLGGISVHPLVQIWFFGIAGVILTGAVTSILGIWAVPRCGTDRIVLIAIGFAGFLAQIFMTLAFKWEKATYVAVMKSNNVILAFIFEFAFFGTVPYWLSMVGASLVMCCSLGITIKKWKSSKKKAVERENHSDKEGPDDEDDEESKTIDVNRS